MRWNDDRIRGFQTYIIHHVAIAIIDVFGNHIPRMRDSNTPIHPDRALFVYSWSIRGWRFTRCTYELNLSDNKSNLIIHHR